MNKEIKESWLKALRSGEYKQDRFKLKTDSGYCCLGVLCDLHAKQSGKKWESHSYLGMEILLPKDVVEWAGVEKSKIYDGEEGDYDFCLKDGDAFLSNLNDRGKTFLEIADVIEQEL